MHPFILFAYLPPSKHPSSTAIHPCIIQTFPFYHSIQLSDCLPIIHRYLHLSIHPPSYSSTVHHLFIHTFIHVCSFIIYAFIRYPSNIHVSSTHLPLCSPITSSSTHLSTQLLFHLPPNHHPSVCAFDTVTLTEQPASIVIYLPNPFQGHWIRKFFLP